MADMAAIGAFAPEIDRFALTRLLSACETGLTHSRRRRR
jgi:hypothetical protein